jgi:hypothetical protein
MARPDFSYSAAALGAVARNGLRTAHSRILIIDIEVLCEDNARKHLVEIFAFPGELPVAINSSYGLLHAPTQVWTGSFPGYSSSGATGDRSLQIKANRDCLRCSWTCSTSAAFERIF